MQHSKLFIRDSGVKVKVTVWLTVDFRDINWRVEVETCQPHKRTWVNVHSTDDYAWRRLESKQRDEYKLTKQLEVCSLDDIREVKQELISKIPI